MPLRLGLFLYYERSQVDPHINPASGVWDDNYYANSHKSSSGGGDFNVNFTPTPSPIGQIQDSFSNLQAGFTGAIGAQTSVPKLIEQYDTKYGIPQIQQQMQEGTGQYDMLGEQIRGMSKSIAQGSQESILTQGQKDRIVQSRQAPLLEQQGVLGTNLSRLGQRLTAAQTNSSKMVEAEQVQQAKELQPWLQAFKNEEVLGAMKMTGWTFSNQIELDKLLANQQAGITLSEGEKNRAQQLSIAEKGFENALKQQSRGFDFEREKMNFDPLGILGA